MIKIFVMENCLSYRRGYVDLFVQTLKAGDFFPEAITFVKPCDVEDYYTNYPLCSDEFRVLIGFGKDFVVNGAFTVSGIDAVKDAENIIKIIPAVQKKSFEKLTLKAFGVKREVLSAAIDKASKIEDEEVYFDISSEYLDTKIEIFYRNGKLVSAENILKIFDGELGGFVYALDDVTLPILVNKLLKLRNKKISVAESFTSGRVASAIISVPGASAHFYEGVVAYSNSSKMKRLGVSDQTLYAYGAVSAECCREMVGGLLNTGECDLAIATTGIAGPASDNTSKPVGLCYVGAGVEGDVESVEMILSGNREEITETAVRAALFIAVKKLKYM